MRPNVSLFILFIIISFATKATAQKQGKPISPDLFGIFFEDLNYAADGGLYGELIQNRSFEYSISDVNPYNKPKGGWGPFTAWGFSELPNGIGTISIQTNNPIHANNPHYIKLDIENPGKEGVGLINYGYNGMMIKAGETYNLSVFIYHKMPYGMPVQAKLLDQEGKVIGETTFETTSNEWTKYTASILASQSSNKASLKLLIQAKGELCIDMLSLFPENTYKNRPNGLRKDIAQTIADLKPKFMRFPGGCLVHGNGVKNIYNWKNSIGPIEKRKGQRNIWGYYQSLGLGFYEYFQFCEDIGAKPLPVLAAGVSCQNSGRTRGTGQACIPMDEMPDYIQDVLDLIEYANGSETSEWGAQRVQAGHPKPFNLEYIGIGNEDKITEGFIERFTMIANAVKEKYPDIKIVGTSGPLPDGDDFDKGWELVRKLNIALVDEHYYRSPQWFLNNTKRYDKYDRSGPKVYLGEYASRGNAMNNALAEAAYLTSLERNGDVVHFASYAPLLAHNDHIQWGTDLIFFGNDVVCPTVNYYVQQLFMTNQGEFYHESVASTNDSTTFSSCVTDKDDDIIIKLVNTGETPQTIDINLSRFGKIQTIAGLSVFAGSPDSINSFTEPEKSIKPRNREYHIKKQTSYEAPAYSLSVLRIKRR